MTRGRKLFTTALLVVLFVAFGVAQDDTTWGPWQYWSGVVQVRYARVNATTMTWAFRNNGYGCTVQPFDFTYSYVDAQTGQWTTSKDTQPNQLTAGESIGGWSAYTANTKANTVILQFERSIECK